MVTASNLTWVTWTKITWQPTLITSLMLLFSTRQPRASNTALWNFLGSSLSLATEGTQETFLPDFYGYTAWSLTNAWAEGKHTYSLCASSVSQLRFLPCTLCFQGISQQPWQTVSWELFKAHSSPFPITRSSVTGNLIKSKILQSSKGKQNKTPKQTKDSCCSDKVISIPWVLKGRQVVSIANLSIFLCPRTPQWHLCSGDSPLHTE